MKHITSLKLVIACLALLLLGSCQQGTKDDQTAATPPESAPVAGAEQQAVVYTCPMHPQVQSSQPGQCPICGMNLVKKE